MSNNESAAPDEASDAPNDDDDDGPDEDEDEPGTSSAGEAGTTTQRKSMQLKRRKRSVSQFEDFATSVQTLQRSSSLNGPPAVESRE